MKRARPYDRDAALDAALNLFWQKGYHATSLKDLEGALNMKPGSIYAAFKSKESLYLAALERYFDRSRLGLRGLAGDNGSPLQALADALRRFGGPAADDADRRACMLVKTLLDTTADERQIGERAREYLDALKAEIAGLFDQAKSVGELPADADTSRLAARYQTNMSALRIEAQRGTDASALAALAEDMAREVEALRAK